MLGATAGADNPPAAKRTFVLDTTWAERVKADPRRKPVPVDSLVLPHAHAANVLPDPYFCRARSRPTVYPFPERVVWRVVPRKPLHAEWLDRRKAAKARAQRLALVTWCEKNDLPACAEFELRRLLHETGDFRKSGYAAINRRWLKHADRQQIDFVFPLPVRGEWVVVSEASRHHRLKHGAAFAFDLVIRKNGKMHRGHGALIDYYAFGQPVLAQADGVVLQTEDRYPDLAPPKVGAGSKANTVSVDYGGGIVGYYGHLRQGSVTVKVGERVRAGQTLGAVGNSGASGIPHLHFSLLDQAFFSVRGRFRYEIEHEKTWRRIDGEDLKAGITVRNAGNIFKVESFSGDVGGPP